MMPIKMITLQIEDLALCYKIVSAQERTSNYVMCKHPERNENYSSESSCNAALAATCSISIEISF